MELFVGHDLPEMPWVYIEFCKSTAQKACFHIYDQFNALLSYFHMQYDNIFKYNLLYSLTLFFPHF